MLLSHKKERNSSICHKVDGIRDHHAMQDKSDTGKQIPMLSLILSSYLWMLSFPNYILHIIIFFSICEFCQETQILHLNIFTHG